MNTTISDRPAAPPRIAPAVVGIVLGALLAIAAVAVIQDDTDSQGTSSASVASERSLEVGRGSPDAIDRPASAVGLYVAGGSPDSVDRAAPPATPDHGSADAVEHWAQR